MYPERYIVAGGLKVPSTWIAGSSRVMSNPGPTRPLAIPTSGTLATIDLRNSTETQNQACTSSPDPRRYKNFKYTIYCRLYQRKPHVRVYSLHVSLTTPRMTMLSFTFLHCPLHSQHQAYVHQPECMVNTGSCEAEHGSLRELQILC